MELMKENVFVHAETVVHVYCQSVDDESTHSGHMSGSVRMYLFRLHVSDQGQMFLRLLRVLDKDKCSGHVSL